MKHAAIVARDEGVHVVAFCGTSLEKAQAAAGLFQDASGYANIEQMFEHGRLDAVYICVPPLAHGEAERQAVERGIPFFIEKPIGINLSLPQEIKERVTAKQLLTSVGYHLRYKDTVIQTKQLLEGMTFGLATGHWMGAMPQVSWWRRQDGSGGQFIEQTTHLVDFLRYAVGDIDEVHAVFAQRVLHEKFEHASVADVGTVTMKLKNGGIANIANTCLLPGGTSSVGLNFYTDGGILSWNPQRLEFTSGPNRSEWTDNTDPYVRENAAFLHALRTGDRSGIRSDYEDAYRTQLVTVAALQSAHSGLPVTIQY
jgi:predicted dehydrogenase